MDLSSRLRYIIGGVGIVCAGLGAFAAFGLGQAPSGAGMVEAGRVALDPGAQYAVLAVEGMT